MKETMTYIITGCTGFVGNVLAKKLLDEGNRVIGFAQSKTKAERVFNGYSIELIYGDITVKDDVEKLFGVVTGSQTVVIHTVAKVAVGGEKEKELYGITVQGTQNVVDLCVKFQIKKLLHISSAQVVPVKGKRGELTEIERPDPNLVRGAYARTKCMADLAVLDAVRDNGLDASILVLSSVIGPGDYSNSHMSQMLTDFVKGKLPASVNAGYNDFDVRDLANVLPAIVDRSKKGEYYFFAHRPNKINDVLRIVAKMENKKLPITLPLWTAYVGLPFLWVYSKLSKKRPLYTRVALHCLRCNANFSIEKAKREFDYCPRPLEETVRDHILFLRALGEGR